MGRGSKKSPCYPPDTEDLPISGECIEESGDGVEGRNSRPEARSKHNLEEQEQAAPSTRGILQNFWEEGNL